MSIDIQVRRSEVNGLAHYTHDMNCDSYREKDTFSDEDSVLMFEASGSTPPSTSFTCTTSTPESVSYETIYEEKVYFSEEGMAFL